MSLVGASTLDYNQAAFKRHATSVMSSASGVDFVAALPRDGRVQSGSDVPLERRVMGVWASLVVMKAAVFLSAIVVGQWSSPPGRLFPPWIQFLEAAAFSGIAGVLLVWGRRDSRAWVLGAFLLDMASAFVEPLLLGHAGGGTLVAWATHLRTDAFHAAALWFFAAEFPSRAQSRALSLAFRCGWLAAIAIGLMLVTLNTAASTFSGWLDPNLVRGFARGLSNGGRYWFWTMQYAWGVPALVLIALKMRNAGLDDYRRVRVLRFGVLCAMTPIAVDVAVRTLSPAYNAVASRDPMRSILAVVVFGSLALLPAAAAYAALVERALDVRLVIRAALQYVLARRALALALLAPLTLFLFVIYENRDRSIRDVASGPDSQTLLVLVLLAGILGMSRGKVLRAIDRRFFREQVDTRETLVALSKSVRQARTVDELLSLVTAAVTRALQPSSVVFALADEEQSLHLQEREGPPLQRSSLLSQLLLRSDLPLDVDTHDSSLWSRLNALERTWLEATCGCLLLPLRSPSGPLLGVLALGPKRSELPYLNEDRSLLAAVSLALALALDRLINGARADAVPTTEHAPALECAECGTVHARDTDSCDCGGALADAPVPYTLDGRLRIAQRIGVGGMGVVYRAVDLQLQQARAVKTLPRTDVALMSRLRREARAMAAVNHPHLATLHALETWRGRPMLVMEFLDGGTLADRLQRGPLGVNQALEIGLALAGGIAALHRAGILHRDVKPSNIGFTAAGHPKLLDFGLARLIPTPDAGTASAMTTWSASQENGPALRGTAAYLAPEVLSGILPSTASDLWGLSVTMLEGCAGINPFRAESPASTIARILNADARHLALHVAPPATKVLFAELLHGDPNSRPVTADEWLRRVGRTARELKGESHDESATEVVSQKDPKDGTVP